MKLDTHQREEHIKIQGGDDYVQTKNQPYWHLDLVLLDSRNIRK